MIRLVQSSSAADRLEAARAFLRAVPAGSEALVVGASRDAADDLVRRLTLDVGASFGIHRASLPQVAARVAALEMARLGSAHTTALGAEALAARVAFEALSADALDYFAPVARFPGFARALASTLRELRLGRIAPDALGSVDVGRLLARFDEALRDSALADRSALFELATGVLARDAPPMTRVPLVLLDVPVASAVERGLVAALLEASPSALVTVPAGDERTLAALRECGVTPEPSVDGDGSGLAHLRTYLFSETPPAKPATTGGAIFFSAPGEGRECVEIARRILQEARDGTPFDRIAILLRAPQVYSSPLETALGRAGISGYFARGAQRPDPAGRAFLVLLECALEKLSARRFAEYLSLGQVPALDADGAPPRGPQLWVAGDDETLLVDTTTSEPEPLPEPADSDEQPVIDGTLRAPWKWEKLLVESSVIGGRERWARRLHGLAAEMRVKIAELRQEEPDSPRAMAIERDLGNLQHLERFALPVIERLGALPARATWAEWIEALEALAPMVLRRPERVLAVLADLRALGPVGPVALDEVRDVLAEELATIAEKPPAARYGRVFVGTLEHARGRAFDVVFIPGLAERMFPQKPREDPILLDAVRQRLGPELRTQSDRAQHERLLLRVAVGAATRRVYLSYSRLELGEARPRVPSFYAMEVQRALHGEIPDPQTLERDAFAVTNTRLAWPAPDDPMRAIDEVEHDLASLGTLLRHRGADTKGRGRYLLELNDALARSLRMRWARARRTWSPYDGLVRVADGTRAFFLDSRPSARAYSVSALQRFAVCPYQFFLSAMCRLAPREEIAPLERLDPLTRGKLFHEVQAECLRALQRAGALPVTPASLAPAMAVLDDTLTRVAAEYRETLAPAIARVWEDEVASLRVDLRTWLEKSVEGQAQWEPFAFELAFGLPRVKGVDARSVRDEVVLAGRWRFRGIVDLVERRQDGSGLRVTDHKTGGNWTQANLMIGKGETLQPVLYGLAVEELLGARVVESRLSYCTRAGGFSERVVPLSEPARRRGLEVLELIDRAIARGFLPPAPRPRACGICDFRAVCGPDEERRAERKDQAALEELSALRSWP